MIHQNLNGRWRLRRAGTDDWLPATVPGGVHLDLFAAGRIPDPFVGENELDVQWVAEGDWEYATIFSASPALLDHDRVFLVCDGLDTLASVRLNGREVGEAGNMFRSYRWDVREAIREGENDLRVRFSSAVLEAAASHRRRPLISANDQLPGAPYLRKAPYHFGWDWGPKLPNVGIWQGIRLEAASIALLDDVRVEQRHDAGRVEVTVAIAIERWADDPLTVRAVLTGPDGQSKSAEVDVDAGRTDGRLTIEVPNPELWWPNGLGGQPLYRLDVQLVGPDGALDARSMQLGLRTVELRQAPDADGRGRSFTFVVNGVPVFAKGSNWIPADSFPARATERLPRLLEAAAAANHNMIRVWGGGYYEIEEFYDRCDRLGLLVWQDFMFACSVYPMTDPAFVENVRVEVAQQVRRLRHRACLALWCGNNEMEAGWLQWDWDRPAHADLKAAYREFFERTLPGWVAAEDDATPYWPSSPSSGRPFDEPIGEDAGDVHQWRVWHELAPFSDYRGQTQRFVSEFGFQSLPDFETVKVMAPDPSNWNLGAPVLDHHQRSPIGNARILGYLGQQFRVPRDFESMVYVSQLLQAEAMRVGVEHWRRHRDRCSGTLYWQLDDCWPVTSWSSIDYFGRWKAAHYASRRMFAPLLLSGVAEDGVARLWLTNDLPQAVDGELRWSLEALDGQPITVGESRFTAGPLSSGEVAQVSLGDAHPRRTVLVAEYRAERGESQTLVTFVPDKHLELENPGVEVSLEKAGDDRALVRLRARSLARFVELDVPGIDLGFENNFFDLPAGREVRVGFAIPDGSDLESIRRALRVRTLADSY